MAARSKRTHKPPPRAPRNEYQRRRDDALRAKGYTKADIHRVLVQLEEAKPEHERRKIASVQGVRSVVDGRYRDEAVVEAFLVLIGERGRRAHYFPDDEPRYITKKRPDPPPLPKATAPIAINKSGRGDPVARAEAEVAKLDPEDAAGRAEDETSRAVVVEPEPGTLTVEREDGWEGYRADETAETFGAFDHDAGDTGAA